MGVHTGRDGHNTTITTSPTRAAATPIPTPPTTAATHRSVNRWKATKKAVVSRSILHDMLLYGSYAHTYVLLSGIINAFPQSSQLLLF